MSAASFFHRAKIFNLIYSLCIELIIKVVTGPTQVSGVVKRVGSTDESDDCDEGGVVELAEARTLEVGVGQRLG